MGLSRCFWACAAMLSWLLLVEAAEDYCLADDENPYLMFATKTSYQFVYDQKLRPHSVPYCRPAQMWLLARHGTRYPDLKEIHKFRSMTALRDQIVLNHQGERKTGFLCHKDIEALKTWRFLPREEDEDALTPQGRLDHYFLAKRLKTNFKDLLDATYTPDSFVIRFTGKERTKESARAFVDGMFGKDSNIQLPDSLEDDNLLVPDKNCSAWETEKKSEETLREYKMFEEGPLVQNLVFSVSRRLGFLYNLTLDVVKDMWGVCRYEKAWNYTATSPWCAAFHRDELQILEYAQDLKYYYTSGPGSKLTHNLGCPLVQDLMESFRRVADNETGTPRAVLNFVHSIALRAALTRLGVANEDSSLTHSNYLSMAKRQWRTSILSPFAGNLAVFFYKCWEGEANQVMFYVDEHDVDYEGCNVGLCSWNYLWGKFGRIVDPATCNLKFCHPGSASGINVASINLLLVIATATFYLGLR